MNPIYVTCQYAFPQIRGIECAFDPSFKRITSIGPHPPPTFKNQDTHENKPVRRRVVSKTFTSNLNGRLFRNTTLDEATISQERENKILKQREKKKRENDLRIKLEIERTTNLAENIRKIFILSTMEKIKHQNEAAIKIQTNYRKRLAVKRVLFLRKSKAVTHIQSRYRGHSYRLKAKRDEEGRIRKLKEEKARVLQTNIRYQLAKMHKVKVKNLRQKVAVRKISDFRLSYKKRKREHNKKKTNIAVALQRMFRGYLKKIQQQKENKHVRDTAARIIQKHYLDYIQRKRAWAEVQRQNEIKRQLEQLRLTELAKNNKKKRKKRN